MLRTGGPCSCVAAALLVLTAAVGAQTTAPPCEETAEAAALAGHLVEAGFEAVGVCTSATEARVTYENRVFRYDVRALEEVAIDALAALDVERVHVVPTRNGLRLVDYVASRTGPSLADLTPPPLPPTSNAPDYKLDVVLHPDLRVDFGDFDDPVRADVTLAPTLNVALPAGLGVTAQVVLPVLSETGTSPRRVRPGIVAVHREARLPLDTYARVSVGLFSEERYGADLVSTTYVQDGRGAVTLRVGRTGFAQFAEGRWTYGAPRTTTYSASVDYLLLPAYGFGAGATYARSLSGEPGWRAEVHRSFGEATVGIFGLLTDGDPNVGGRLTLPLPLRRHPRPRPARVRLADRLDVEYRYRRTAADAPDYKVSPAPWDPLGPLNPALLPYHLRRHRAP